MFARVVTANRDMDPVLSCVDAQGRAAGFGALKAGLALEASLPYCRALLAKPPGPVLATLGAALKFELAVGMNGRVWVHSGDVPTTVRVVRALSGAAGVPAEQQAAWVAEQTALSTSVISHTHSVSFL